jgi:catechol 2,3-dioxygenase-like lactoylglutathione lyase family enzyme
MSLKMKLTAITLDCPDPKALAAFYQQATGLELVPESDDDFAGLSGGGGLFIGFQRVADYQVRSGRARARHSSSTSISRSTILTRPRPCYWSSARPSLGSSPAATGGGFSSTQPGTRSV